MTRETCIASTALLLSSCRGSGPDIVRMIVEEFGVWGLVIALLVGVLIGGVIWLVNRRDNQ